MTNKENRGTLSLFRLYTLTIASAMSGLSLSASALYSNDFLPVQTVLFVLCILSLILLCASFKRGKYIGAQDAFCSCFSYPASCVVFAAASVYFIIQAALGIHTQKEMIKLYLLSKTPDDIIIAALALTAAMIFYTGLRQLASTAQLLFFIIFPIAALLLIFGLIRMDRGEIRVLLDIKPPKSFFHAARSTSALWGIESVIFFLGSKRHSGSTVKAVLLGFVTVFVMFAASFCAAVGSFSLEGAAGIKFPFGEMARTLDIGGITVTERFDILFVFIEIIGCVIKTAIAMYCAGSSLEGIFRLKSHRCFTMILPPFAALLAFSCASDKIEDILSRICSVGFCCIMFIVTPLVALITFIKKGRTVRKTV